MIIAYEIILLLLTTAFIAYPLFRRGQHSVKPSGAKLAGEPRQRPNGLEDDVEEQISQIRKQKAVCPECGARNPQDAKFCSNCGAGLSKGIKNG
jgi:ribosomal protein L40E